MIFTKRLLTDEIVVSTQVNAQFDVLKTILSAEKIEFGVVGAAGGHALVIKSEDWPRVERAILDWRDATGKITEAMNGE